MSSVDGFFPISGLPRLALSSVDSSNGDKLQTSTDVNFFYVFLLLPKDFFGFVIFT